MHHSLRRQRPDHAVGDQLVVFGGLQTRGHGLVRVQEAKKVLVGIEGARVGKREGMGVVALRESDQRLRFGGTLQVEMKFDLGQAAQPGGNVDVGEAAVVLVGVRRFLALHPIRLAQVEKIRRRRATKSSSRGGQAGLTDPEVGYRVGYTYAEIYTVNRALILVCASFSLACSTPGGWAQDMPSRRPAHKAVRATLRISSAMVQIAATTMAPGRRRWRLGRTPGTPAASTSRR